MCILNGCKINIDNSKQAPPKQFAVLNTVGTAGSGKHAC